MLHMWSLPFLQGFVAAGLRLRATQGSGYGFYVVAVGLLLGGLLVGFVGNVVSRLPL
jgi:hypothetical protein